MQRAAAKACSAAARIDCSVKIRILCIKAWKRSANNQKFVIISEQVKDMNSTQTSILIVFIIYIIFMVAIGFFFSRRKMSNADYVLGGRSLNPWVTAMSAQASDMSGWLLTGLPGLAFAGIVGSKEAIFTAIGLLIGTLLNWLLVARRLRVYTEVSSNSLTISSYLSNRFHDKSNVIKVVSAIVICVFFTVYSASMFSASANLFQSVFGIPYIWALLIGVAVIVAYVLLGGFLAVSWTDFFQGILMFLTLILVPLLVLGQLNGADQSALGDRLAEIFRLFPDGSEYSYTWLGIISALGWGLGYFGMPHILVRFMAIKQDKQIRPAMTIAMIWTVITLFASIFVGIMGVFALDSLANSENVFITLVVKLFPALVAGIMLSAVLAAIMSTADSQLLVASTAFSNDVYTVFNKRFLKRNPSDRELMWTARITVFVLSMIGFVIAIDENSSIFRLVQYAWGGLGASFGPVILFSLYSKKINRFGAIASIAVGAITTVVWKYGLARFGGIFAVYELVPGFILATAALFLVSLLTEKYVKTEDRAAMDQEFANMKAKCSKVKSEQEADISEEETASNS